MRELEFRTATKQDLDRVIVIHGSAFPDPRLDPARRRNFLLNPLGTIDRLWLAIDAGEIVGHAFLFALDAFFGGRAVRVAAIASVGVAPEARGRGVAGALLEHLHRVGHEEGAAIAMLYAFRHAFYARHGYAPVSTSARCDFAPEAVPASFCGAYRETESYAARAPETPALEVLYDRIAETKTGYLRRPRALWDAKWLDERNHVVAIGPRDAPRGYALYAYSQSEAHARTTISVEEMVAIDPLSRRALFGFFGVQRDQVTEITIDLDHGDPIMFALVDPDRRRFCDGTIEHALGTVIAGPMVRVLDLDRALSSRGYMYDTRSRLRLGDRMLSLSASGGQGAVSEATSSDVEIDDGFVGSVLFGGLTPTAAASLGFARGAGAALANADTLLGLPPFAALDRF
ncbi:N/A [soil metagenome]